MSDYNTDDNAWAFVLKLFLGFLLATGTAFGLWWCNYETPCSVYAGTPISEVPARCYEQFRKGAVP